MKYILRIGAVILLFNCFPNYGEVNFRLNLGSELSVLDSEHYWQWVFQRDYSFTNRFDIRVMFEEGFGNWRWDVHGIVRTEIGDRFQTNTKRTSVSQRYFDLRSEFDRGSRHQAFAEIDRLSCTYQNSTWRFSLGRFPTTWGRGLVFHPNDLYNSYSPLSVDRMYKVSNDGVLFEKFFQNNWELHVLSIARQQESDSTTNAIRVYVPVADNEFDFFYSKHFEDTVNGFSFAVPIRQLILRFDYAQTCSAEKQCYVSSTLNFDFSFDLNGTPAYAFLEYFYQDVGIKHKFQLTTKFSEMLNNQLRRGETHTIARDSLAMGGMINWHPLWNQSLVVIANLHDSSKLLQTHVSYSPSNSISVVSGMRIPFADVHTEYGKKLVDPTFSTHVGGESVIFFEIYYFR
ncbi:MAG: hypothetical protein OXG88_06265 [Gammaproteobacteria bacterium]|nr:hypothetical protein [Gammaproteobacteria bacterium]